MIDNSREKKFSFGYEDTDKKIEIDLYGLNFEIDELESVEELGKLDKNNSDAIEAQLEKLLGKGAIERINKKRKDDGYKELDLNVELSILGCIFETYAKSMSDNVLGRMMNVADNINKEVNSINREQRRDYNRNNYNRNNYRGNNRNYRRY